MPGLLPARRFRIGRSSGRTQYQLAETPDTAQPSYGIWNASVALVAKDGWTLRGLVRFVPRDDHRYFGAIASYRF